MYKYVFFFNQETKSLYRTTFERDLQIIKLGASPINEGSYAQNNVQCLQ